LKKRGKGGFYVDLAEFLKTEGPSLLALSFSFLLFFHEWSHPLTQFFLSLDLSVLYEPVYFWVHQHLTQDKLPLICDNAMHGAPIAAYSMAGVLSPFLWLFHWFSSYVFVFNLLFLAPQAIYLFGTYFLGRRLGLSMSASLLLAFFWGFNGHQMAQLDHLNVAWAHAFFPWAFLCLLLHLENRQAFWLLASSFLMGLNLLSGHPQVFFLECLFFLSWALLYDLYTIKTRLSAVIRMGLGALVVASPLILFTAECLKGDFQTQWGVIDRFYHSWTPLNFLTLIFPWFFGKAQYDRAGLDYWWQYQFVEMQVAFSIAGLFFILLFFSGKNPRKKWIAPTFLFALVMAMGKFTFFYSLVQSLPVFSFFRDPSRYWFLATWVLGIGAAMGWDQWFGERSPSGRGRKLALGLTAVVVAIPLLGMALFSWGRPLLEGGASFFIRHFLLGDATHPQSLAFYQSHIPQKLEALEVNFNPLHPRVLLPMLFSGALMAAVWSRYCWKPSYLKFFLLLLVLADLYAFRMPLGNAFYKPSDITAPQVPAPENRTLTLLYDTPSPLPNQYGEMAYPNMNIAFNRPNLVFDANPTPRRYADIWALLGWFSWVYKDRDPLGFSHNVDLLQMLGIDQIVSDIPMSLPTPFKTIQNHYPFTYFVPGTRPKAYLSLLSLGGEVPPPPRHPFLAPEILKWDETRLSLRAPTDQAAGLLLQKTFLTGWKVLLNGNKATAFRYNLLLTGIELPPGNNQVELKFDPTGLRLGFFLFFAFFGVFCFFLIRRLLA
jgi:hypothetical protein